MTFQERAHNIIMNCVRQHNLAVEGLTEEQFVNCIKQAINCGDFKRLIRQGDNAQQIIYIPFEAQQRYENRIKTLEEWICLNTDKNPDDIE